MESASQFDLPAISPPDEGSESVRGLVALGAVDAWVHIRSLDDDSSSYNIILLDQQHNAVEHAVYQRVVRRLDSLQAVQQASQWRLNFDPSTQRVFLHSIVIRRAAQEIEHADIARLRFFRRETQMENLVLDGSWTAVLLLEDVRAGDVLDVSYTVRTVPRYLEQRYSLFAEIPTFAAVRAFHLSIRFPKDVMKWTGGDGTFQPNIEQVGEDLRWSWTVEHLQSIEAEPGVPSWHLASRWVHVSSYCSWQEIASGIAELWRRQPQYPELTSLARQLLDQSSSIPAAIRRAIEFIQDDIRYLSVNEDFGGQIPASPDVVMKRRYGDCKDKALLLAELLKEMGIEATPVLVNTRLRGAITNFLPSPNVFNHAVVRYRIEDQYRWVDATASLQGGDALSRASIQCEAGLPLDTETIELEKIDSGNGRDSSYKLEETLHLDTASQQAILAVKCVATGVNADELRRSFILEGVETVAKRREQFYRQLFPNISRVDELQWADDRPANRVAFAENFRVENSFARGSNPKACVFAYRTHLLQSLLALPSSPDRKLPFALPRQGIFEHFIEMRSPTMARGDAGRIKRNGRAFDFHLQRRKSPGMWIWEYYLQIREDAVRPEDYDRHRRSLEEIWPSTGISVTLPIGIQSDSRRAPSPREMLAGLRSIQNPEGIVKRTEGASHPVRIRPRNASIRSAPEDATAIIEDVDKYPSAPAFASASAPLSKVPKDNPARRKHRKRRPRIQQFRVKIAIVVLVILGSVLLLFLLHIIARPYRGY